MTSDIGMKSYAQSDVVPFERDKIGASRMGLESQGISVEAGKVVQVVSPDYNSGEIFNHVSVPFTWLNRRP